MRAHMNSSLATTLQARRNGRPTSCLSSRWSNGRAGIGHATITYNAPLDKYLLCITDGGNTISAFNSFILEADAITGPYRLVSFMERFGEQAYFLNIPSKYISVDGRTMWLCYSANFTNHYLHTDWRSDPAGSCYALCLQEITLGTSN